MTNVDVLLPKLREYRSVLQNQVRRMREEYNELAKRWSNFSAVYEGAAADQFRAGWIQTVRHFNDYMDVTERILAILESKIAELEKLAQADL